MGIFLLVLLMGVAAVLFAVASSATDHSARPFVPPATVDGKANRPQALTYTVDIPYVMGPVPPVALCSNHAANGDFESPSPGHPWTGVANTTSVVYQDTFITTVLAHGGAKSGRVGSSSLNNVWNEMMQTVQMPDGVVSATLTYWRYLDTTETSLTVIYDKFTAGIETEQGIQIAVPQQIDNTSGGRGTWVQASIDLPNASAYAGQRLWLSFKAATDSNLPSSLYVDDVSFVVCTRQ
jgi:hypothetical protein